MDGKELAIIDSEGFSSRAKNKKLCALILCGYKHELTVNNLARYVV